jgi:mono/diheme cytochrome c family protein
LGLRAAVLIAVLLLTGICSGETAPRNHCLGCHPAHYPEQGSCRYCHLGNQQTSRKQLAHSGVIAGQYATFTNPRAAGVIAGIKLAEQAACRRCHVLNTTGNHLASNLDNLLWTTRPEAIRTALLNPALYMPVFRFSEQDLDNLVTTILAGGRQAGKILKEPPQVVHFNDAGSEKRNIFSKHCGGCHKVLSKRDGGLGSGTAGPNLSGLLTRFYPPTFTDNTRWSEEKLKRWVKNPRAVRKNALMRPVSLNPEEWDQLLNILNVVL